MLSGDTDHHHRATVASILFDMGAEKAERLVEDLLKSENPRLIATGIYGVYRYDQRAVKPLARELWRKLLTDKGNGSRLAGLEIFGKWVEPALLSELKDLLIHGSARVQRAALEALQAWPDAELPHLAPVLEKLKSVLDPDIRRTCVKCYRLLPSDVRDRLCLEALDDSHPQVRDAALTVLRSEDAQFAEMLTAWLTANAGSPRLQKAALSALSAHHPAIHIFREIAEAKTLDAQAFSTATRVWRGEADKHDRQDSGYTLMGLVLEERLQQTIDLALMSMEHIEDPVSIGIIRAGLSSGDRRQVANACEALRYINNKKLAERLGELLDAVEDVNGQNRGAAGFRNAVDILKWCEKRPDSWLRNCAKQVNLGTAAGG